MIKTKTLLSGAVLATVLTSAAIAQEPPVLFGNFSSNIEGAVNLASGPTMPNGTRAVSVRTRSYGFSQQRKEERPLGNYSANVRIEDVRGR